MNKAIFLDRDGTLIEDVGYLSKLEDIKLIDSVVDACRTYQSLGYKLFIITNQSGIARGYFTKQFVEQTNKHLTQMLSELGVYITKSYYCPHHPDFDLTCSCRKPSPGMLKMAANDFNIDLSSSIMIGDKDIDVIAGKKAGCKSFLVSEIRDHL